MKKYSKVLSLLLALAMILPGFAQPAQAAEDVKLERLAGLDRVETAIKVSQKAYDKADTVVLAGYNGEADALTGTILAKDKNAPMLLTYKDKLDAKVVAELNRLGAKKVYILGGETVVFAAVETALKDAGFAPTRLKGDTRVETAVAIANEVLGSVNPTEAFAVEYNSLADALAIGPVAANKKAPILITYKNDVPAKTEEAMKAMQVKDLTVVGGENVVSQDGLKALEALTEKTVARVSGSNRELTSIEVANKYNKNPKAVVLANGYKYADALVGGYFAAMVDAPILLTNTNKIALDVLAFINEANVNTYVLGGETAVSGDVYTKVEEQLVVVEDLKIESVSAISAKELKVTFNKAVVDTTKAEVEIKKGSVKVNTSKITWNEEKTEATVELTGKITAGEYTVNVTGLTEEALAAKVTAQDEKVTKIMLLDDKAAITNDTNDSKTVTIGYKVENQYGEDITATIAIANATAAGTSVRNATASALKGTVTIDVNNDVKVDDSIVLTLVHTGTGTSVSETIKVAAKSKLADIAITNIYNKDEKTLTETTDLSKDAFYLIVEGKDQYGNILEEGDLSGLISNNTNPLIASLEGGLNPTIKTITVNKKEVTAIKLTGSVTAGETTVMLISPNTGKNATQKIAVAEAQRTDKIVLEVPALVVAGEELFVPITVTDKEGNTVTDLDVIKDGTRGIKVSGLDNTIEKKDGQIGVKVTSEKLGGVGYKSLVAISSTSKSTVANFEVKKAAEATIVTGLKDVSTTLLTTKTAKLSTSTLQVEDQYGRVMTEALLNTWVDKAGNSIEVSKVDGTVNNVTLSGTSIAAKETELTVTGNAKGTQKIDITLKNSDGVVTTSTKEVTFRVTDGTEYASYEVDNIGTMFDEVAAGLGDQTATPKYNKDLKVYGLLADGSKVRLAADKYSVIMPTELENTNEVLNVANNDDSTESLVDYGETAKEVKVNVVVTINASGAQFTKEVTISKVAPKIVDFKVVTDATEIADKKAYDKVKEVTEVTSSGSAVVNSLVDFVAIDSYGEVHQMADGTNTLVPNLKLIATPAVANTVTFTNQNTPDLAFAGLEEGEVFTVKASSNGVEKTLKVTGTE